MMNHDDCMVVGERRVLVFSSNLFLETYEKLFQGLYVSFTTIVEAVIASLQVAFHSDPKIDASFESRDVNQHSTDTLSAVISSERNCVTDNENTPVSVSSDAIKEFGEVNERDNETPLIVRGVFYSERRRNIFIDKIKV